MKSPAAIGPKPGRRDQQQLLELRAKARRERCSDEAAEGMADQNVTFPRTSFGDDGLRDRDHIVERLESRLRRAMGGEIERDHVITLAGEDAGEDTDQDSASAKRPWMRNAVP